MRLSYLALIFAILSVGFLILLILFRTPFPAYPLMSYQDALDVLTPLVLVPLYWLLFRNSGKSQAGKPIEILFMVFAALWVMGQGMHLSANSINNLAENSAASGGPDILDSQIYELVYFYDEHLSHYLWHIGVLGLAVVIIFREALDPAGDLTIWWATILAGLLYGFTVFAITIEGQTALLGFPFAVLAALILFFLARSKLGSRPMMAFFFVSFLATSFIYLVWVLYAGGLVEPTRLLPL